ncbi:MAG: hypothetical protein ACFBSF_20230 [Leptolyngbyaceae cyanobacterium]
MFLNKNTWLKSPDARDRFPQYGWEVSSSLFTPVESVWNASRDFENL